MKKDSLWNFEFNVSGSFNIFSKLYDVIKQNGIFNNNIFENSLELNSDSLLLRYIKCKYIKGMLSFRFGETHESQEIQEDFIYQNKLTVPVTPVTKWNKSKILEQLKKADNEYKEIYSQKRKSKKSSLESSSDSD